MERLEFLEKARQLAHEQIESSSCLPDFEFAELSELDEEVALYKKAKSILEEAVDDIAEA